MIAHTKTKSVITHCFLYFVMLVSVSSALLCAWYFGMYKLEVPTSSEVTICEINENITRYRTSLIRLDV